MTDDLLDLESSKKDAPQGGSLATSMSEACRDSPAEKASADFRVPDRQENQATIHCLVDEVGPCFSGWAYSSAHPDTPFMMRLYIDGQAVGEISCNISRPDVAKAGHALFSGFKHLLPKQFADGQPHLIELRRLDGHRISFMHGGLQFTRAIFVMSSGTITKLYDAERHFAWSDKTQPRLGIAITTYNRKEFIVRLVEELWNNTKTPFSLVVCDDGSHDGTVEELHSMGVCVVGGVNRGVAWNKNRGLAYLLEQTRSDVLILLDDDVTNLREGWEIDWIEATKLYAHLNVTPPDAILHGAGTPSSIALTTHVMGYVLSFTREMLSRVGYMDTRFGRYGHEHTDLSYRCLRAGGGGVVQGEQKMFFALRTVLGRRDADTTGSQEMIERNAKLLWKVRDDPIYRNPWHSEDERRAFFDELRRQTPPLIKL